MLPKEGDKKFSIPSKFDTIYKDFKFITETASYRVFEAQTRNSHEKHLIRILDPTKNLVVKNFGFAAMLFIRELSYLQIRCPGSVLIKTLEINKARKQIACAIRHDGLVSLQLDEIQQFIDLNNPKVIEKLLNDVISDVEFLWRNLQMKSIASIIVPENIYYSKEKGTFFLGNWDKITEENSAKSQDLTSTVIGSVASGLRSQDIAAEIKELAFVLLKMKKVDVKELEFLLSSKKFRISTYKVTVKKKVSEGFSDSQKFQNLIERMLSLDPENLPNLEEFKLKEDKIRVPFEKNKNEANMMRKKVGNQAALEESKLNISSNSISVNSLFISSPQTLLAWCSVGTNMINVIDLATQQNYVIFDGARNHDIGNSRTHIKEIPDTKLLVSLHHRKNKSANLEIFDISKKGKANKIYSLGNVSGKVGSGNVTYNPRRSILGAIPDTGRIAYHLFTIDTTASNTGGIVKLIRKSKWHSQYSTQQDNFIAGFDFNPAGDSIATIDSYGVCLISDVNTNNRVFHLRVGSKNDDFARCRWSTATGEPILFVKYDARNLNIIDIEKRTLILSNPIQLAEPGNNWTNWIDLCQGNSNLLASGGSDIGIKIFDKRKSKIVKTFKDGHLRREFSSFLIVLRHLGGIRCVRWDPSGDMIASASDDKTAKLLDFKTGKVLYTGITSDKNRAMSVCFI